MSEWKEMTLGDVADYLNRGITPSYSEDGVMVINQRCIREGRINFSEARFTDALKRKIPDEKLLRDYDILICSTGQGTLGRVGQLKQINQKITVDSHVSIIRGCNSVDPIFLGYLLKKSERLIEYMAEGSTGQTELPRKKLFELPIFLPPLYEQRSIANILCCFDNKIDLLRRQNETLEAIAQTLFKSWFVEFEFPNKEGQPYKSSDGKMVSSELGEIPEGWKAGLSGDIILLQGGVAFKSKDFKKVGKHGIIKIKNIQNQVVDILNTDFVDDEIVQNLDEKFRIKPGDVLIAMTGAEVAKVGIVPQNDSNLWLNQRVGLFKNKINNGVLFIYYLFSKPEYQKALRDKGTGSSAQPNISATDIESIRILVPDINVLNDFAMLANPMFNKVISNLRQIQLLAKTRDTLLPKLMSSQIRVTG